MTCRTWWIIASIVFFVGMIMGGVSFVLGEAAISVWFALLNAEFAVAGWVLWFIGLISYIRER